MVLAETAALRDYELVLILKPDLSEEKVKGVIDKVTQTATSGGGSVAEPVQWGRRKLVFPMRRYREGNYILLKCKLAPRSLGEIEANLKLSEDVLRHMMVRV